MEYVTTAVSSFHVNKNEQILRLLVFRHTYDIFELNYSSCTIKIEHNIEETTYMINGADTTWN